MRTPRAPLARLLLAIAGTALLPACATLPERASFTAADLASASVLPGERVRFWADGDADAIDSWREALLGERRHAEESGPATLLAISGGSDKGAFSAGILNAWTARGDRPEWTVVTGVSTGALIAPFAFLGPEQDEELRAIYTGIDSDDIYNTRIVGGLLGGASLLDSEPLAELIASYVTPEFLDRIALEHRRGRRLLVLTTNLDAQRGVIWDMGAIAESTSPRRVRLFQRVLLASASIPGAFPPVLIDVSGNGRQFAEMHADGGAISGFLILPQSVLEAADTPAAGPGETIHLLYNGRSAPDFEVVEPRTFEIMERALSTALGEADRANIAALRTFSERNDVRLSLCAIDDRFDQRDAALFDTQFMRDLYQFGVTVASEESSCLDRDIAE